MSEYVIMPKADYVAACNAIREKTGKTDLIKSGDMRPEILGITTGGGSSEDVRYVTFMSEDGTVELGKKAVATGDDCADPIARGIFSTPTKESTDQYNFTFSGGWATTPGGGKDSNALKAVTEDRTVYANFIATVRYYTVSFYDGDTLLTTKSVAYGATATYSPDAKEGYFFDKWEPVPENITGDMDCYAQWKLDVDFATASWKEIATICEAGEAQTYFSLGDSKELTFKDPDGTSCTVNMAICGFNHDDLADGSGKAGISLVADKIVYRTEKHSTEDFVQSNWANCDLRKKMNTFFNAFPAELQGVIKEVKKKYGYYSASTKTATLTSCNDKVWIPSAAEMGEQTESRNYVLGDGEKYPYFVKNKNRVDGVSNNADYWVRSGCKISHSNSSYQYIKSYSCVWGIGPRRSGYVAIGFCI